MNLMKTSSLNPTKKKASLLILGSMFIHTFMYLLHVAHLLARSPALYHECVQVFERFDCAAVAHALVHFCFTVFVDRVIQQYDSDLIFRCCCCCCCIHFSFNFVCILAALHISEDRNEMNTQRNTNQKEEKPVQFNGVACSSFLVCLFSSFRFSFSLFIYFFHIVYLSSISTP